MRCNKNQKIVHFILWFNFILNFSHRSLEVGSTRPSPGSVGKLRISNEMKHKLELVTANHSLRSTGKPRPTAIPSMQSGQTGKLDSDRRLLLQQQLGKWMKNCSEVIQLNFLVQQPYFYYHFCWIAGRWGSVDSVDSRAMSKDDRSDIQPTNIMRSQVSKILRVK